MSRNFLKTVIFVIILSLFVSSLFAGCGKTKKTISNGIKYPSNGEVYPMETDATLSVWGMSSNSSSTSLESSPFGKKWQELTGVTVEFQQPMAGTNGSSEGLSLLIASGDLSDIIISNLYNQPGGIKKFADDGVIIRLNEVMDKYAPNLVKYLNENKDIDKMVKSDDGSYYMFPFIRGDEILSVSSGPVIRKDLLDEGGLAVPETIDEWYVALKYFKERGADAPLSYDFASWEKLGVFLGAYGVKADFYVVDGKVKYGYLEPQMKDALSNLKKWYDEGLLDKNFIKIGDLDSKILTSEACASVLFAGSGLGKYLSAMREKDPKFHLVPTKFPVLNKGDKPMFGTKEFRYVPNNNGFITTACQNVELAARFLDFGYSEKGHMLFNFGIEGESYVMEDGYPRYTELITKNPEGLSMSNVMVKYMRASMSGPFVQDKRYIEQYYTFEQQKDALKLWSETDTLKYNIPMVSFDEEQSQQLSSIMNNVKTYVDETVFKFIMGIEPIENYDKFVNQLKALGIEKAIEIYQKAVENYQNR